MGHPESIIDPTIDEPCPCSSCRRRERCAARHEACVAFSMFVHGRRWQAAPRAPSGAIYEVLFEDEPGTLAVRSKVTM